jgi:hypothetical protein
MLGFGNGTLWDYKHAQVRLDNGVSVETYRRVMKPHVTVAMIAAAVGAAVVGFLHVAESKR